MHRQGTDPHNVGSAGHRGASRGPDARRRVDSAPEARQYRQRRQDAARTTRTLEEPAAPLATSAATARPAGDPGGAATTSTQQPPRPASPPRTPGHPHASWTSRPTAQARRPGTSGCVSPPERRQPGPRPPTPQTPPDHRAPGRRRQQSQGAARQHRTTSPTRRTQRRACGQRPTSTPTLAVPRLPGPTWSVDPWTGRHVSPQTRTGSGVGRPVGSCSAAWTRWTKPAKR